MPWEPKLQDPIILSEVVARYQAGATPKSLEDFAGVGESAIRRLLKREGVVLRGHHEVRTTHTLDETAFDTHPHAPYWVWLLLTDGHVRKDPRRTNSFGVCLSLQRQDAATVEAFRQFLGYSGAVGLSTAYASLQVSSKKLFEALSRWGVTPQKTREGAAHPRLVQDPAFWRGVIDGDGSLWSQGGKPRVSLCSASERLVRQFAEFCQNCYATRASVRQTRTSTGLPLFVYTCAGRGALAVLVRLYEAEGPSIVRKRARAFEFIQRGA